MLEARARRRGHRAALAVAGATLRRGGGAPETDAELVDVELVDDLLVPADQRADRGDLVVAGSRFRARPFGQLSDGGGKALAASQQLVQVFA